MDILKQSFVKYGLLLTAGLIVCLALMEITGNNESFDNKSPIFFAYQFIYPAVVWYFGLKAKKKQLGGKLTYKQGLKESFKMSLIFALSSPFIFLIYYVLINPAVLNYVKTAYGMPDASNSMIISIDLAAQFVAALFFGTLYGAVISFFVKSK